jgi:hypothetical protein
VLVAKSNSQLFLVFWEVKYVHVTISQLKSTEGLQMYLNTLEVPLVTCFELHPRENYTTDERNSVRNSHEMGGQVNLTILLSIVQSLMRIRFSSPSIDEVSLCSFSPFQLSSTKDIENKQTLMHYLFEIVEQHYPDCQLFIDDLFHVEAASRVSPDLLQKSLRQMESNIKGLEMDLKNCNQSDPDDRFIEVLGVSLMSILFYVYSHLCLCFFFEKLFLWSSHSCQSYVVDKIHFHIKII